MHVNGDTLAIVPDISKEASWITHHNKAVTMPSSKFERQIVGLIVLWREYAEIHSRTYSCTISECAVMGEVWKSIGEGLLALLDGDTGRLQCGHLSNVIRELCKLHGMPLAE